ncbi:hypothetical protein [Bosea sp. (in: a-proteobacteria)]|uniref:hypothetical protein n=1 Tax=Bosea sp. (in: a-proteobacteria) TaxID=1871050 RepID=UPI00273568F8|nr:hypothetical protein [Bosea sp. (in: a-proteobacteria)]MDP3411247.1 hypothetical protein [Bosea sp. (in: a-proteobacteria)]
MATTRKRRKQSDTELETGDLLVWDTPHGKVLVWVVNVLAYGAARPLLEVLDWLGDVVAPPARLARLGAAVEGSKPGGRPLRYVATDLIADGDARLGYARIAAGFARAGFAPTKETEHGLHAPYVDVARLTRDLEAFALARTAAGRAAAARAARDTDRASAERARARIAAAKAAAKLTSRRVPPRVMQKPREVGAQRFVLSLTGKDSHEVWFVPGAGNMTIAPRPDSASTPHAVIGADELVHWDGLDVLPKTGGGSAMPRRLRYEGSDAGIFAWLTRREAPLEHLTLSPKALLDVDASGARVNELVLDMPRPLGVRLVLLPSVRVTVRGDASRVRLKTSEGKKIVPRVEVPERGVHVLGGWCVTKRALHVANAALTAARRGLEGATAKDRKKARAVVDAFVDALNALHASKGNTLFTAERDDVAAAIDDLFSAPPLTALADEARAWLEARRDF